MLEGNSLNFSHSWVQICTLFCMPEKCDVVFHFSQCCCRCCSVAANAFTRVQRMGCRQSAECRVRRETRVRSENMFVWNLERCWNSRPRSSCSHVLFPFSFSHLQKREVFEEWKVSVVICYILIFSFFFCVVLYYFSVCLLLYWMLHGIYLIKYCSVVLMDMFCCMKSIVCSARWLVILIFKFAHKFES